MRKIIFILIAFTACMFSVQAQERTVNLKGTNGIMDLNVSNYVAYNGTTSDYLLPTTRDTIDYYVQIKNPHAGPMHFYAVVTLDKIVGTDTTVAITVQEKKFGSGTYVDLIASALTSVVSTEQQNVKTSLGVTTMQTATISGSTTTYLANTLLYYNYLRFRLILTGNDHTGTGVKVKRVELQIFN